jgi:hypothetical protein
MAPLCVAGAGTWHACMYERDYANRRIGGRERLLPGAMTCMFGLLAWLPGRGGDQRAAPPAALCSCQGRTRDMR